MSVSAPPNVVNSDAWAYMQNNDQMKDVKKITFADGSSLQFSADGDTATITLADGASITIDMSDPKDPKVELDVRGIPDGSATEEGIEAGLEKTILQMGIDTAGEDYGTGKKVSAKGGGSWWLALFAKLGEQLNNEAAALESRLDSIAGGDDDPGDLLMASAQMQRLGFMMSQDGAIVSSFGSGAKGLADGAK